MSGSTARLDKNEVRDLRSESSWAVQQRLSWPLGWHLGYSIKVDAALSKFLQNSSFLPLLGVRNLRVWREESDISLNMEIIPVSGGLSTRYIVNTCGPSEARSSPSQLSF